MKSAVTIVIPTRNRLGLLIQTLKSIMEQDWRGHNVIVCDNCSNDGTGDYVIQLRNPRITVVRHGANIGLKNNWVFALRQAKSEFVCLTSDDDLYHQHYLSAAVCHLNRFPQAAFYACSTQHFMGNNIQNTGLLQRPNWMPSTEGVCFDSAQQATAHYWLQGMPLAFNSMCIRTEALHGIQDWGGDGWPASIDYLLAGQLAMARGFVFDMAVNTHYRLHEHQTTGNEWKGKARALEHWYVIRRLAELGYQRGILSLKEMIETAVRWDATTAANLVIALASSSNKELRSAARTIFHEHTALRKGQGSGHMRLARMLGPRYLSLVFPLYKMVYRWPPAGQSRQKHTTGPDGLRQSFASVVRP
jgi:glycosyltransferase involved in cell wall biosynthesis